MTSIGHRPVVSTSARPPLVTTAIVVLWFLGLTALGGSIGFFADIGMRDPAWLEEIPLVVNYAVPGLVLGLGFGVGSLVTAYGLTRRPHWSWLGWLDFNALHATYGAIGLILALLPLTPSFRDHLAGSRRPV
jgi:hypothetical protein